jgi:hypothetical protein
MTLTLGHVGFAGVYVQFLESFDVRSKRPTYAKLVSKLVRNSADTLLMYILASLESLDRDSVEPSRRSDS